MNNSNSFLETESKSSTSGKFNELTLTSSPNVRILCQAEYVRKDKNTEVTLRLVFHKQRKNSNSEWSNKLSKQENKDMLRLELNSENTLKVMQYLKQCEIILSKEGFMFGKNEYIVLNANNIDFTKEEKQNYTQNLTALFERSPKNLLKELANADSDEINEFVDLQIASQRRKSLKLFSELLQANNNEATWHKFFEENTWIFGYGLRYHFLNVEQSQVLVGGKGMDNKGGQITDFLASTTSKNARYSVLIEIKTPQTELLYSREVRNSVIPPHHELSSAVAQVQTNILTWQKEGSQDKNNFNSLHGIHTVHPKSLLVIGNLRAFENDDQKTSFELYRRNIKEPEIITFDELYERAKFIVENISLEVT